MYRRRTQNSIQMSHRNDDERKKMMMTMRMKKLQPNTLVESGKDELLWRQSATETERAATT